MCRFSTSDACGKEEEATLPEKITRHCSPRLMAATWPGELIRISAVCCFSWRRFSHSKGKHHVTFLFYFVRCLNEADSKCSRIWKILGHYQASGQKGVGFWMLLVWVNLGLSQMAFRDILRFLAPNHDPNVDPKEFQTYRIRMWIEHDTTWCSKVLPILPILGLLTNHKEPVIWGELTWAFGTQVIHPGRTCAASFPAGKETCWVTCRWKTGYKIHV